MEEMQVLFPSLSELQWEQLNQLGEIYPSLNKYVNVISRKDIGNLYTHHVLHSMFIDKIMTFKDGTEILDLGTGGGFPGIPMAILYPQVQFTLVDGTRKKIGVAQEVSKTLGLKNVVARQQRAEEIKGQKFDFVVSRAVAGLDKLLLWSRPLLKKKQINGVPNGLFAWKGGNIKKELGLLNRGEYAETYPLSDFSKTVHFEEKHIIYVQG